MASEAEKLLHFQFVREHLYDVSCDESAIYITTSLGKSTITTRYKLHYANREDLHAEQPLLICIGVSTLLRGKQVVTILQEPPDYPFRQAAGD